MFREEYISVYYYNELYMYIYIDGSTPRSYNQAIDPTIKMHIYNQATDPKIKLSDRKESIHIATNISDIWTIE